MTVQSPVQNYLDITDTLARLYLFLAQTMDRCLSEEARSNYPEAELQGHLASTRAAVLGMLAGNPVVKQRSSKSAIGSVRL